MAHTQIHINQPSPDAVCNGSNTQANTEAKKEEKSKSF